MAAGTVDRTLAEWLIVALIVFALFVEFILHKLEHWISHRHPQLQAVLRNLYRELMILGMVSFGFILFIFTAKTTDDVKLTFEVAHVFIFVFAVFHTIVVMAAVFISLRLSKRWKSFERMDLAKYLEKKDAYRKLSDRLESHSGTFWRYVSWWFPKPSRAFRYWKLHEVMTFHDTRFQFIYYRNLPPDFHFASFLRKIKSATFIELVEIHWTVFLCFLGVVLLDLARGYSGANFGPYFEPSFLIAESVFNILFVALLAAKIRRVYWKMTKNPATYYDAVDRRAVQEERMIAEEEARISKELAIRTSLETDRFRPSLDKQNKSTNKTHHAVPLQPHQPIYANMAYVPPTPTSGTATPTQEAASRHSMDWNKDAQNRMTALTSSDKPGRYVPAGSRVTTAAPIDGPVSISSKDSRRSTELNLSLPTAELAARTANSTSIVVGRKDTKYVPMEEMRFEDRDSSDEFQESMYKMERIMSDRSQKRTEAIRRIRNRKKPTASIAKNAMDLEIAQQSEPTKNYPPWLLNLVPRLGRVASPAEKLFWFGSHKFFIWCVGWVLFFSTINLSASLAKVISTVKKSEPGKKDVAKAVKFVVHAAVSGAKKTTDKAQPKESLTLLYVALGVAILALIYVLMRIAGIMKKYVFVLNNANLLPESMTIQAIQNIRLKSLLTGDETADEEYLTDVEEPESVQMRRNISSFLGTEAEKGFMPGVFSGPVKGPITPLSPLMENGEENSEDNV